MNTRMLRSLTARFGGKRPFVACIIHSTAAAIGAYSVYQQVNWTRFNRLIFVCKGNISRSPFAEHYAASCGLQAASFGLDAESGSPADPIAVQEASRRGLCLEHHRSKNFRDLRLRQDDLILCFEPIHARRILEMGVSKDHVTLLGLWNSPRRPLITDPYARPAEYYSTCFDLIECAVRRLPWSGT